MCERTVEEFEHCLAYARRYAFYLQRPHRSEDNRQMIAGLFAGFLESAYRMYPDTFEQYLEAEITQ